MRCVNELHDKKHHYYMRSPARVTPAGLRGGPRHPHVHCSGAPDSSAVTRRLLLSACSALLASGPGLSGLPSPSAAAVAAAASPVTVFAIESSELDRRSFRGLQLSNGLRVLLCSDPEAGKAAAAMNVAAGSLNNPPEWPGLAHFCEHMLFLGTERFPEEGEFERYISSNGGSNNAFTAGEDTNYYFDCGGDALPGALTRFADFFAAPLFSASGAAREVDAVDSEHSKNLQSDFWRADAVLRLRARREHPYSRFATGNRATLRGGDGAAREALLAFYRRYYKAPQMALAVAAPQSLDELQRLVTAEFAGLPAGPAPLASADYDALSPPFDPPADVPRPPPVATVLVPVREQRSLTFSWNLPLGGGGGSSGSGSGDGDGDSLLDTWLYAKPESTFASLVSRRGKGSLNRYLKDRGLASSVDVSVEEQTRSWILLSVYVSLTERGLREWREVGTALFSYLRLLREQGVPRHVYTDAKALRQLSFRYAEPAAPGTFVQAVSGGLALYEPRRWLSGPALMYDGGEPLVQYLLRQATPERAIVKLTARELEAQATSTEQIYGARYGDIPISRELAATWAAPPRIAELGTPPPNRYVPTDLTIKAPPAPSTTTAAALARAADGPGAFRVGPQPQLLERGEGLRLHFLQDRRFGRPKAFAYFALRSPQLYVDPKASITAELYQAMLADALQDEAYEAAVAGLTAGVGVGWQGLGISLGGYNQRLPELAALVASQLRSFPLSEAAFERRKDSLRRQLRNAQQQQPVAQCAYQRNLALQAPRFSNDELLAALEPATLSDVRALQATLLPRLELEAFVCGNVRDSEAQAVVAQLRSALPAAPLPLEERPRRRTRRLAASGGDGVTRQFVATNAAEINSAVEVYLQVGPDEGDDWLLLTLLAQMVSKAFYSELRTRQQLGYIVQSGANEIDGVRGLSLLVQSTALPPPELQQRVDGFLRLFRGTLVLLPEEELRSYTEAISAQLADVDNRLDQQATRLWNECAQRRYDFGRPWRNAARVRRLTKPQLLAFFDRHVADGSPTRRRLNTHIFAQSAAPSTLRNEPLPEDRYPALADRLEV